MEHLKYRLNKWRDLWWYTLFFCDSKRTPARFEAPSPTFRKKTEKFACGTYFSIGATIARWISDAWKRPRADVVAKPFRKCQLKTTSMQQKTAIWGLLRAAVQATQRSRMVVRVTEHQTQWAVGLLSPPIILLNAWQINICSLLSSCRDTAAIKVGKRGNLGFAILSTPLTSGCLKRVLGIE